MIQGLKNALRRHYAYRYSNKALVLMSDDKLGTDVDIKWENTFSEIINNNIRFTIYKFTTARQNPKKSILSNSGKKLLLMKIVKQTFKDI